MPKKSTCETKTSKCTPSDEIMYLLASTMPLLLGGTVQLMHTVDWHVRPLFKA